MVRISLGLTIASLALAGCQQTRMGSKPISASSVSASPTTSSQLPPSNAYIPPTTSNPNPSTQNPGPAPVPVTTAPPDTSYPSYPTYPTNGRTPMPEPRDPTVSTPQVPTTPTVSTPTYPDPLPTTPVVPEYQPPTVYDPDVVQPPPRTPDPSPNPGTDIVVQPPVSTTTTTTTQSLSGNVPLPTPVPSSWRTASIGSGAVGAAGTAAVQPQGIGLGNVPLPPERPSELSRQAAKPVESVPGQCGPLRLDATEKIEEAKLDVLFMVDTSASLRGGTVGGKKGELEQIASQMEAFVMNFPEKTDINVGIMLGHGHGQWVGRLFRSSKGEAAVLKTTEIRNRADLIRRLENKMKNVPNESGGAQGEALLYSLFQAVKDPSKRADAQAAGMFRNDASLAVIMVTDEQDVCFDYNDPKNFDPETGKAYIPNGKKNSKGQSIPDPVEVAFFNNVCKKAFKGGTLKPDHVHEALTRLKGGSQKLVLMGIVYTKKDLVPAGVVTNALEDENEMGHGIIEFVGMEKGKLVDLGQVKDGPTRFREELSFLGKYTRSEISSNGNVSCDPSSQGQPPVNAMAVDLSTLKVQLLNDQGQVIGIFSADCNNGACKSEGGRGALRADVRRIASRQVLQAFLDAKTLNHLLNAHKTKEAKVLFTYMTRTDRDPSTGKPNR